MAGARPEENPMQSARHCFSSALCLAVAVSLSGCITAPPVSDPRAAALAGAIGSEAARYYAGLAAAAGPDCQYEHNMNTYARLGDISSQLTVRLADRHANAALIRAGNALSRTIDNARLSHQLASARTDDANGACMAPGAIALNADAITRASAAIASTQQASGDK